MFCTRCGARLDSRTRFCVKCGALVTQREPKSPVSQEPGRQKPPPPVRIQKSLDHRVILAAGSAVLVLAIVAAALVWFVWLPDRRSDTRAATTTSAGPDTTVAAALPSTSSTVSTTASVSSSTTVTTEAVVFVPDVVGLSEERAREMLRAEDLGALVVMQESAQPRGRVVAQEPMAGAEISAGTSVSLTLSKGPSVVEGTTPDFVGLRYAEAFAIADSIGLSTKVSEYIDTAREPGVVASQEPAAGSRVTAGSQVDLDVIVAPPASVFHPALTSTAEFQCTPFGALITIPAGWQPSRSINKAPEYDGLRFDAWGPSGCMIRFDTSAGGTGGNPRASVESMDKEYAKRVKGYRLVSIQDITFCGYSACRWEFTSQRLGEEMVTVDIMFSVPGKPGTACVARMPKAAPSHVKAEAMGILESFWVP